MSTVVRLQIEGLHELMSALRRLPEDLTNDANLIVRAAAEGTAADTRARYPVRTGALRRGLQVRYLQPAKGIVSALVISSMYYAHFLEFGTRGRKSKSKGLVGAVTARHYMLPVYYAQRDRMHAQLVALCSAAGFEVEGNV